MFECQTLNPAQLFSALKLACSERAPVSVTFLSDGKWHLLRLSLAALSDNHIVLSDVKGKITTNQPVGICVTFGHYKYLFDSQVLEVTTQSYRTEIAIEFPRTAECMPRRACLRQPVPATLNVRVLFWHRGYIDDSDQNPAEQYWQGRLLNLSAGGAQFEIDNDQKQYFSTSQLLGIQFTPMSYQNPFCSNPMSNTSEKTPKTAILRSGSSSWAWKPPKAASRCTACSTCSTNTSA